VKKLTTSSDDLLIDPLEGHGDGERGGESEQDHDSGPVAAVASSHRGSVEEYNGERDGLIEKKPASRAPSLGKKPTPTTKTGPSKKPMTPSTQRPVVETHLDSSLSLPSPSLSQSPVIRDDERSVTSSSSEVNESVRASLQLLKKKPRSRGVGILARGTSTSDSVETLNEIPEQERPLSFSDPSQALSEDRQSDKPMRAAPLPTQPPPNKPFPTRKVSSLPSAGACTRTSDCTCALCQIPVEELPIVEIRPHKLESHEKDEVMIGSSKLTTLMKTRQEMNKQKEGKKKEVKSAK
jgi:hypothetical protein